MIIRRAQLEDIRIAAKLTRDTIRTVNCKDYTKRQIKVWSSKNTFRRYAKRLNDKSLFRVIAVIDNKIVGTACLKPDVNELAGLYIKHTMHGKGIGSKLLVYIESCAKRKGLRYIRLYSTLTAVEFYRHHGYKRIRKMTHLFDTVEVPCVLMKKDL